MNELLSVPNWNAAGQPVRYDVDHMIEYQLGGADEPANYELLDSSHNRSIGPGFAHEVRQAVGRALVAAPASPQLADYTGPREAAGPGATLGKPTVAGVLQAKNIVFAGASVRQRETRQTEGGSTFWTRAQIDAMVHVREQAQPAEALDGAANRFALRSPTDNLLIARFRHEAQELTFRPPPSASGGIAGLTITEVALNRGYNEPGTGTARIGTITGTLDFGSKITLPDAEKTVMLPINPSRDRTSFSGRIGLPEPAAAAANFNPASPLALSGLNVGQGVYGRGVLYPSHPALAGINIPATLINGRLGLFYTLDAQTLAERMPIPGLTVDSAAITLGFDGSAFSVAGGADFTIRNFGQGQLRAMVDSDGKFQLEGDFRADPRLFDRADMRLWYRSDTGFGGSGTLAITNPDKIPGVRAASVTAGYDNGVFSAAGTVEPNIPGLQSAG
ncbi:MAG TPA: hypothetical protein VN089_19750, partial [Duganella sp.]|nr:hypothetical protein [Duganella sp.]